MSNRPVLELRRQSVLVGPSLAAPVPVIVAEYVPGDAPLVGARAVAAVAARLSRHLPALTADRPRQDATGESPAAPGAVESLCDLAARTALALQREFGYEPLFVGRCRPGVGGSVLVAFEYVESALGLLAGEAAVAIVNAAAGSAPGRGGDAEAGEGPEPGPLVLNALAWMKKGALGVLDRRVCHEAVRRGIPWSRVHPAHRVVRLGQGRRLRLFQGSYSGETSYVSTTLATAKDIAAAILRSHGVPVPRHVLVANVAAAVTAARTIGYPVVLKPRATDKGIGVSIGLTDEEAVSAAFHKAREHGLVLVEQQIAGDDHRATVIRGRVVAVGRDMPAHVVGDGHSSVRALIDALNRDPRRGDADYTVLKRVHVDEEILRTLASQQLDLDGVPEHGRRVALRWWWRNANDHTAEDLTDRIHPANREMIERAVRLIGLDVAGVDFITPDIARPWYEVGGAINEVNPTPGLNTHVRAGSPDILRILVEAFFPADDDGRIPCALLIGAPGGAATTRVGRRAAAMVALARHVVGLATADGVSIGDSVVERGDAAGLRGLRMMLEDPATAVAIAEVTDASIGRDGLGVDRATVGAVIPAADTRRDDAVATDSGGASRDAWSRRQSEPIELVASHVTDVLVLDADDPNSVALESHSRARQLCWVARRLDRGPVAERIRRGDLAVTWDEPGEVPAVTLWVAGRIRNMAPIPSQASAGLPLDAEGRAEMAFAVAIACGLIGADALADGFARGWPATGAVA